MDFDKETMILSAGGTMVPMISIENNVWYRGIDCASVLDYKDPKRAIKRHVDVEWQQTLETLLQRGGYAGYLPNKSQLERPKCKVDIRA